MPQKKNKALGRGLEALFSAVESPKTDKDAVVMLKLDEIRTNPYQPRRTFDEESLQELAASIKKQGVFQPVIVRPSAVMGYELRSEEHTSELQSR